MFGRQKLTTKDKPHNGVGQIHLGALITAVVGIVAVAILLPMVQVSTVSGAISRLEGQGHVVLSASEYATINTKLDDIKISADLAVANAEAAVVAAQTAASKVDLFNSAEVFVYPTTTTITCVFTAGNTNTWSAWTEIIDSGATTLSSMFAVNPGYISDIHAFLPSDTSDGYNLEVAYGEAKTILGRVAFWVPVGGEIGYQLPIKSRRIPAGETIYYRLQSTGASGATVQTRIRYFYE